MLLCSQVHALAVVDAKLEELADQSRVTLVFDQVFDGKLGLFRIANPARQVVDFPLELSNNSLPLSLPSDSRIKKTQLIAAGGKSRLVFELAQNYEIKLNQKDSSVELTFSGPKPFIPGSAQTSVLSENSMLKETVAQVLGKPAVIAEGPVMKAWTWNKVAGKWILRLEFDRSDIVADANLRNDQLNVRFANVRLAPGVKPQLQTTGDSPISQVELKPGDVALTVQMKLNGATHTVRQNGSVVEVEVTPPLQTAAVQSKAIELKAPTPEQSTVARYIGRPITLDFKDADIRTVMQVFADFTKMNLVLSDSVKGKVTVFLKDVPWDQALDIVMRSKGLVSSQSGNVLLVSTPADVVNDQFQTANRRAQDEMEPLASKVFQVSYQKTADLVALIKSEDSKLLSTRGTLISDERTSQIFVQDTPSRLERISMIINGLDKPVKQVMIEARVVLADTSVSKDLGVRMRALSSRADPGFADVGDQFGRGNFVNSGVEGATNFAYTLFNANSTRVINLQLRALELENKVRTVSNPRVITSNKEPALIEQGTEIPYQIATSSGATATEFKEANLKLAVTPQIAPDGTVLLDVDIAKDSIGIETSNGPAIDTRRVKTKVLVTDGGTVVLGGIFEEDDNILSDKTPFLGDIPGLGVLFRGKNESKRRAELLIFLTPVVLAGQ
ncbi:MAG: type IV pilus secretin PilQ [Limnobacter sp.]